MLAMTERPPTTARQPGEVEPYYCRRCDNPKPLGMLGPGHFWSRQGGRTIIAEGGTVRVWCERCSKEHTILLDSN